MASGDRPLTVAFRSTEALPDTFFMLPEMSRLPFGSFMVSCPLMPSAP